MTTSPRAQAPMRAIGWASTLIHDRRLRLTLSMLAVGYLVLRWYLLLTSDDPLLAADAYTYWSAPYDDPYTGPQLGLPGAYLYPPPFLQALAPLRLLPWEAFHAIWAAIGFGALVFLVGPIGAALVVTLLPFVFRDLLVGNIHLMLAAAIVVSFRWPALWAFPILTKLTPGVGVVWFAARREWARLAVALGVTAVIAAASVILTGDLWVAWLERMRADTGTAGDAYLAILVGRGLLAAGIVAYAGRSGRAWLVPIAVLMSLPILWPDSLALLVACVPLISMSPRLRAPGVAR